MLIDLIRMAALAVIVIGLAEQGVLSVQLAAWAMAAIAVWKAFGGGSGRDDDRPPLTRREVRPLLALGLLLYASWGGHREEVTRVIASLGGLFAALLGIYIIGRGVAGKR